MQHLTDFTGLSGVASVLAVIALRLPGVVRLAKVQRAILIVAVFVLALVPFGALPLAGYARGATGDLSITSIVLLWVALLRPWITCEEKSRVSLLMLAALSAVVFYPLALGVGIIDPYRIGYGEPLFVLALLVIALVAWYRKSSMIVLCIALALFAWSIGWYESGNLWDYLLDPFVSIYAVWAATAKLVKRSIMKQR